MREHFVFPDDCEYTVRWFSTKTRLLLEQPMRGRYGLKVLVIRFPQVASPSDYKLPYGFRVRWTAAGMSRTRRWKLATRGLLTMQRVWGDLIRDMVGRPAITFGDGFADFEIYPEHLTCDVVVSWVVLSYAMWSCAWMHNFRGKSTGWAGLKNRLALVHKTGPLEDAVIEYCHGQLRQYERGIKPKPSRISEALLVGDKGSIPAK